MIIPVYLKHIIHIDDFPLNGHPPSNPTMLGHTTMLGHICPRDDCYHIVSEAELAKTCEEKEGERCSNENMGDGSEWTHKERKATTEVKRCYKKRTRKEYR